MNMISVGELLWLYYIFHCKNLVNLVNLVPGYIYYR